MDYSKIIKEPQYDFLYTNQNLKDKIILLGVSGSHAYGTNTEDSDLDLRGVSLNSKKDLLGFPKFDLYTDKETDTTIFSFNKMIALLCNCNPNVIEILGLKPEHYLLKTEIGDSLIKNANLFLSQKAASSFTGYAKDQLRRLENKSSMVSQEKREEQIKRSLEYAYKNLSERYNLSEDSVKFFVQESQKEGFDKEMFVDIVLKGYPLRDFTGVLQELVAIVRNSDKLGRRGEKAVARNRISKHQMHLLRLYYMGIDILESEKIITYREKEHDILMKCRNGDFLNDDDSVTEDFSIILNDLENKLDYAIKNTSLPIKPDMEKIEEFVIAVNEKSLKE